MKWPLKNKLPTIPEIGAVGDFGYRRSFYHHSGIDLYCDIGQEVQAIEDGIVTHIENFTGPTANPPSPWWNETWAIMIEGRSGSLGYCELKPLSHIMIGMEIFEGEAIGTITPVLKKDKGWGKNMLHFELYKNETTEHVTWLLDAPKPPELINPRKLLEQIKNESISNNK